MHTNLTEPDANVYFLWNFMFQSFNFQALPLIMRGFLFFYLRFIVDKQQHSLFGFHLEWKCLFFKNRFHSRVMGKCSDEQSYCMLRHERLSKQETFLLSTAARTRKVWERNTIADKTVDVVKIFRVVSVELLLLRRESSSSNLILLIVPIEKVKPLGKICTRDNLIT